MFQESEAQPGSKSLPGRGVTLQMLLEEKMLEPGTAAMTIEYLVNYIFNIYCLKSLLVIIVTHQGNISQVQLPTEFLPLSEVSDFAALLMY